MKELEENELTSLYIKRLDSALSLPTNYVYHNEGENMIGSTEAESLKIQSKLRQFAIYSTYMQLVHLEAEDLADFIIAGYNTRPKTFILTEGKAQEL